MHARRSISTNTKFEKSTIFMRASVTVLAPHSMSASPLGDHVEPRSATSPAPTAISMPVTLNWRSIEATTDLQMSMV